MFCFACCFCCRVAFVSTCSHFHTFSFSLSLSLSHSHSHSLSLSLALSLYLYLSVHISPHISASLCLYRSSLSPFVSNTMHILATGRAEGCCSDGGKSSRNTSLIWCCYQTSAQSSAKTEPHERERGRQREHGEREREREREREGGRERKGERQMVRQNVKKRWPESP